jgi:hypothetical protein
VSWITIRNYGFSDATEIFVFISGYTAAFVYGRAMLSAGFVVATARVLKRAWQIYVAHVFLFAIYLAEISYVVHSFDNPLYSEEMGVLDFMKNPDVTILQALLSDRHLGVQSIRLAVAVRVRRLVRAGRRAAPGALDQLSGGGRPGRRLPDVRLRRGDDLVLPAARLHRAEMARRTDLSDRQNQSRRAAHPPFPVAGCDYGLVRAARLAGQHSLGIFCLGVFLSFAGHFVFTEVSNRVLTHVLVSIAGIAIMVAAAWLISWYRVIERQGPGPRPPATKTGFAGGNA